MTDKYLFGINFTALKENVATKVCDFYDCLGCPYFKGFSQKCLFHEFVEVTERAAETYDRVIDGHCEVNYLNA